MDKRIHQEGQPDPRNTYTPLAQWLQETLAIPAQPDPPERTSLLETGGHPAVDYHPSFYQQLPDFVMALLKDDAQATLHYAPLFFHLIGCATCHMAYLELYSAMRAALVTSEERQILEAGPHALALTPPRMLVYTCQLLVKQADVVLLQARRSHLDRHSNDAWARALLRGALTMSSHIHESTLRQRALQDLVRVATLALDIDEADQATSHSYTALVGIDSGTRHGSKTRRRAEMLEHPTNEARIDLQAGLLDGMIVQEGDMLHLILRDLDESLRGRYLLIAVPLGALLEPVRWLGRNPRAIHSQTSVDAQGTIKTPLGTTDLRLTNREDHNLLEAMFKKLDVRPVDL